MSKTVNPRNYVTDVVTFSYANVFEPKETPSGTMKYSACLLLDKKNKKEKARWDACVEAAFNAGVKKGLFSKKQRPIIKTPIRDGDAELETGVKEDKSYKGRWFINASSFDPIEVTTAKDGKVVQLFETKDFFSGCYGRAIVSFYPYNKEGGRGIAVALNGVFKIGEGERLDGKVNASSVFAAFADEVEEPETESEPGEDEEIPF